MPSGFESWMLKPGDISARRAHDFYETAPWQVDALVDHLPELTAGGLVFCPCVGDGSLMRQLSVRCSSLAFITNDYDVARSADYHFDATSGQMWEIICGERGFPDWVIENFPFNVEHCILPWALPRVQRGLVAMTRVSFTEPTRDRGPWLKANPYQKRITLERHSFTGNGKTDSATTDWLVWAKQPISGPFGISAYGYRR